jgi:hypothetical protein
VTKADTVEWPENDDGQSTNTLSRTINRKMKLFYNNQIILVRTKI